MDALAWIAERRIEEAMAEGAFDLWWHGRPLDLDSDQCVPTEHRLAFRILRNAGFVPPEVELRRELADLTRQRAASTGPARAELDRRIEDVRLRLGLLRPRPVPLDVLATEPR